MKWYNVLFHSDVVCVNNFGNRFDELHGSLAWAGFTGMQVKGWRWTSQKKVIENLWLACLVAVFHILVN